MARGKAVINIPAKPTIDLERELWTAGIRIVAGVDEAGRGAWAGPVCAAAVVLPNNPNISQLLIGVRDSKRMTPNQRELWCGCIKSTAVDWTVAFASYKEIDAQGIVPATCLAMNRAINQLKHKPKHLLVDYLTIQDCNLPQTSLPKGDARSLSIAAASVLAKTARDELMVKLDNRYLGYGFARHKGYGTPQHRQALQHLGLIPVHRRSYFPMKTMITKE
jgi:ribonuclease HII